MHAYIYIASSIILLSHFTAHSAGAVSLREASALGQAEPSHALPRQRIPFHPHDQPSLYITITSPTPPTPTIHHTHTKSTMSIIYHHNLTSQPPLHNRELLLSECPRHQGRGIDAPGHPTTPPNTPTQSSSHRRAATINTQSFVNYTR